jgi:hypothetical protein
MAEERFTIAPTKNENSEPVFAVLVKRTYDIRPKQPLVRAEQTPPLIEVDVYYDDADPEHSTVKYESELAPYKIATDVVVVGKAHAPQGRPTRSVDVSVEVAGTRKVVRVIGDRRCIFRENRAPAFTEPEKFTTMEMRYERAYGGKDLRSNPQLPFYYPRNHKGTGVAVKNVRDVVEGLALPNLEDPQDLLAPERVILQEPERWNAQPLPQGIGWFQPTWYPRCSFVGAMPAYVGPDDVMREEKLGIVPKGQIALARQLKLPGYDVRFNNGASLGLVLPFLKGSETVRLTNLTPDGDLSFSLPGERPRITLDLGEGEQELTPVMHTLCVRLDAMQADVIWRGALPYPGIDWIPQMKTLVARVA